MGPIRVNLSASGVGLSAGIRGARVGVGPRGTYISLSAAGFQYRRKLDDSPGSAPSAQAPAAGPWQAQPMPPPPPPGTIHTASVASLQQTSPDEVASEIERCAARADWFKAYWIAGLVLFLLLLLGADGWFAIVVAVLLVAAAFPVHRWNAERRTARLIYDVDDPAAMERFALASAAGEALGGCAALWHVHYAAPTLDARRNAGATTLQGRTPTRCVRGGLPGVETNLEPWSIGAGPQQLLFLPDRLLVQEGKRVAALAYEHLLVGAVPTRFIEEGPVPPDGQVIDTTWRYVRKDGGPDLRFNDNYQIPVLRYGELTISSPHGVQIVFQTSQAEAAQRAAHALGLLAAAARRGAYVAVPAPTPAAAAPAPVMVAPAAGPAAYTPAPVAPQLAPAAPAQPVAPIPSEATSPARRPAGGTIPMQAMQSPPVEPQAPARTPPLPTAIPTGPSAPHVTPSPSRADVGCWIPPGGPPAFVAGYTISGGMLYLGEHLPPVRDLRDVEPALINPKLPVDRAHPNRSGEGMPYWPSYSAISPRDRAGYLEWLAGGRSDPQAYIGYVFLFLYGLERRLLADSRRAPLPPAERDAIHAEIVRLLALYGGNRSFHGYATEMLGAMWVGADVRVVERLEPPLAARGSDFPLLLRLALGQLAREGRSTPADWALAWALCDPEARLPTPIRRCPEETRALFRIRYSEAFGQGMVCKPGAKELRVHYRPASASFGGELVLTAPGIPDVTSRRAQLGKLHELLERCSSELDGFSRWVGKNPDRKGSAAAIGLLPPELVREHQGGELSALREALERHLTGKDMAIATAGEIVQAGRTKAEVVSLAQLLQKLGYGIEPDVRFGGELPDADREVAVFRLPADAPATASASYKAATLIVHLAVAVAAADGEVSEAELQQIDAQLGSMETLGPAERTRLLARAHLLARRPPGLAGIKRRLGALDAQQRSAVADLIVAMAAADGRIDPAEVKLLAKLFPMLGLEEGEVYRRVHALAGAGAQVASGPVSVQAAEPRSGVPSSSPASSSAPGGVALDMELVQAKLAETSAVSALLGSIFTEEEPQAAAPAEGSAVPPSSASPVPPAAPVRGLDRRHSALVRKLSEQPSWSRAEVEAIAAELGLLPDGALEVINETAFDACGAAVWSGDDPLEIEDEIMKELCA